MDEMHSQELSSVCSLCSTEPNRAQVGIPEGKDGLSSCITPRLYLEISLSCCLMSFPPSQLSPAPYEMSVFLKCHAQRGSETLSAVHCSSNSFLKYSPAAPTGLALKPSTFQEQKPLVLGSQTSVSEEKLLTCCHSGEQSGIASHQSPM